MSQMARHRRCQVRPGSLGVEVDELHVLELWATCDEGIEEQRWRRGATVDEDAVAGRDVPDRVGGGNDLHVGPESSHAGPCGGRAKGHT